ncbi:MAG: branched-chain amino acid ABC transporter permease [Halanaerobiales bacterium]|nr:branched-chain amino acid ABC transporter permease [Halanaerobiales bacterium]
MFYHLTILMIIYSITCIGLNIVVGYTGFFSFARAAFFGIGAYTSALLVMSGVPFLIAIIAGGILAAIFGWILGLITVEMTGDYFALATFAFAEMTRQVFINWTGLTRGPLGLPGIPRPEIFGFRFSTNQAYLFLYIILLILVLIITEMYVKSPFGRLLKTIREDETAAQSLGKNIAKTKNISIAMGAFFGGVGGALYAHYITYIDPSAFVLHITIFFLIIVIAGGMGNNYGTILGAVMLVLVRELPRYLGLSPAFAASLQQMVYSSILVILMLVRPRGLLGERKLLSEQSSEEGGQIRNA